MVRVILIELPASSTQALCNAAQKGVLRGMIDDSTYDTPSTFDIFGTHNFCCIANNIHSYNAQGLTF